MIENDPETVKEIIEKELDSNPVLRAIIEKNGDPKHEWKRAIVSESLLKEMP